MVKYLARRKTVGVLYFDSQKELKQQGQHIMVGYRKVAQSVEQLFSER